MNTFDEQLINQAFLQPHIQVLMAGYEAAALTLGPGLADKEWVSAIEDAVEKYLEENV